MRKCRHETYVLGSNDVLEDIINRAVTERQNDYSWLIPKERGNFCTMVK